MKLSYKINLFLAAILIPVVIGIIAVGTLVINSIIYDLNQRLLNNELEKIHQIIEADYHILKKHGLNDVDAYVENAKKALLQRFHESSSNNTVIIVLSSEGLITKHTAFDQLDFATQNQMKENKSGTSSFNINGIKYFGTYNHFNPWEWTILIAEKESSLFSKRKEYVLNVSLLALFITILVLIISSRFGTGLSRRIELTLNQVNKIKEGNYSARIVEARKSDEISDLQSGINIMASALEQRTAEQHIAEQSLKASEQYNRMLFDQSPIGLVLARMDGSLVDSNSAYAKIIGYTISEVEKLTYWEITPEKYASQEKIQLERLNKTGNYGPYEKEYIHKDSHLVPVRLSGNILERNGERFIWSCVEDITEQKNTEATKRRLMNILETTPDLVSMANKDGRILYINKSGREMIDISESEDLSKLRIDDFHPPESIDRIRNEALPYAMKHGYWQGETELLLRNKQIVPLLQSIIVHKGSDGEIEFMSTVARDISEIKQAKDELKRHRDHLEDLVADRTTELRALNKELESFSYSISHDLRAPLRSISGFAYALAEDYADVLDETGKDYANRVCNAIEHMNKLIDAMLLLSRLTRQSLHVTSVNLSELSKKILDQLSKSAQRKNSKISITPNITVKADANLLEIAMNNLLNNAWKYTGKTEITKIEFGETEKNGEKVYFVKDNGAGFDMKYVDKIFGAFQRLHHERDFEGTGIGLATVQRIIHRHEGRVWAESEVNKGTVIYFTLNL